ncbi:MAG: hypothetical protein V3U60_09550 [Gammaproteobacteria bacterium]
MAIAVHLVEKKTTVGGGKDNVRNRIKSVLVAIDDTADTTGALIQARAQILAVANGQDIPVGYFDTNRLIGIGTGVWDAIGDFTIFDGEGVTEVIA